MGASAGLTVLAARNQAEDSFSEKRESTPLSYWLLLVFLVLLYANTPKILPALEVVRPAKVIAIGALLALASEKLFGKSKADFAMPDGGFLVAFLFAAALSCLTALWPGYAVDALSDLAKMVVVYFFIVNCANSERLLQGVMWVMVVGGLFPALGTIRNYLQGNLDEGRASWVGIFANPNEVAYSLVILLPLAAYLAASRGWFARIVLLGISVSYLPAILVTFSRGGVVGLAAVAGLYALRKRSLGLVVALAIAGIGAGAAAERYWSRGQDFSDLQSDVSFQERIATSKAGLEMFADHPLTGVGLSCSVIAWPLYAPEGLYTRGALITHNTLVQLLSETGILGFVPYFLFLSCGVYRARKLARNPATKDLGVAVEVAIWGFLVCGMSGGYVLTWFPYILLGIAAAAGRIGRQEEETEA